MAKRLTKEDYARVAEIARCARAVLSKNRWIKGRTMDNTLLPSGRLSHGYCLVGAIQRCISDGHYWDWGTDEKAQYTNSIRALEDVLGKHPIEFNDHRDTRKTHVMEVLAVTEQYATEKAQSKRPRTERSSTHATT